MTTTATNALALEQHDRVEGERDSVQLVLAPDATVEAIVTFRLDHGGDVMRLGLQEAIAFAYMLHDVLKSTGAGSLLPR